MDAPTVFLQVLFCGKDPLTWLCSWKQCCALIEIRSMEELRGVSWSKRGARWQRRRTRFCRFGGWWRGERWRGRRCRHRSFELEGERWWRRKGSAVQVGESGHVQPPHTRHDSTPPRSRGWRRKEVERAIGMRVLSLGSLLGSWSIDLLLQKIFSPPGIPS